VNGLNSEKIVRANVALYKGPEGNPEADYCEIRLEVPGNDHFVKKHSPYFETSVAECVEVLTQMIQKTKDKKVDRRQADREVIQNQLAATDDDDVELEDIVR
jgi:putative sigma-54 modulation protein